MMGLSPLPAPVLGCPVWQGNAGNCERVWKLVWCKRMSGKDTENFQHNFIEGRVAEIASSDRP